MTRFAFPNRRWFAWSIAAITLLGIFVLREHERAQAEPNGKITEEIVYARCDDGITNGGVLFTPAGVVGDSPAVIWVHGSGVNFYYPSYVKIGRAVAARGYTFISANTRMRHRRSLGEWRGYSTESTANNTGTFR